MDKQKVNYLAKSGQDDYKVYLETLENLLDRSSPAELLENLAEIASLKAQHLLETGRIRKLPKLGKHWPGT